MSVNRIEIVPGDITKLEVDAIVTAANNKLLGGGGVDGAIHRAAGANLLALSRCLGGCETGQAKMTPAFSLPARWVIHAVGPIWQGGEAGESELLASCYRVSMQLAAEAGAKSVSFPAISCGAYGYPLDQAARIAISEIAAYLDSDESIERVVLVVLGDDVEAAYRAAYDERFSVL